MRATFIVLGFALFLVIYGYALTALVPRKWYSFLNILVALGGILYGKFIGGLSLNAMGFNWSSLPKSMLVGFCIGLPLVTTIYAVSRHPKFMPHFLETARHNRKKSSVLYDLGFRVPFGTAFSEEVLFRGVLLGMLLPHYGFVGGTLIASLAFGLWHIAPTIANISASRAAREILGTPPPRHFSSVAGAVFTTTLAGMGFSALRIYTGNLFAPWLIHSLINGASLLSGHIHAKNEGRKRPHVV